VFSLLRAGQSFVELAGASINVLIDIFSDITARCWSKEPYYVVRTDDRNESRTNLYKFQRDCNPVLYVPTEVSRTNSTIRLLYMGNSTHLLPIQFQYTCTVVVCVTSIYMQYDIYITEGVVVSYVHRCFVGHNRANLRFFFRNFAGT
jgi:hypothetical protein